MIWKRKSRRQRRRQRQLRRRRWREKRNTKKIKRQQRHENSQLRRKRRKQAKNHKENIKQIKGKRIQKTIVTCLILFAVSFFFVFFVKRNLFGTYIKEVCVVEYKEEYPVDLPYTPIQKVSVVLLSEHTISNPSSSEDRNWNMWLVSQILNKEASIIMPGETFSYLETVGNTTEEKGFRMAGVINNGKSSSDFGGGVCQVTSTYNSALIVAGIPTHAMVHSVKSKYIVPERGDREAAVAYSSRMDFKFTNTTPNPLKTQLIVEGGSVTSKIFKIEYQKI